MRRGAALSSVGAARRRKDARTIAPKAKFFGSIRELFSREKPRQANVHRTATLEVPPALALAATYTREVRVGIDRIWENVLDWEHLPALHEIYFDRVRVVEISGWGWRVELAETPGAAGRRMVVELRIDRANARYCVRTLAGEGAATEIWTLLEALGPQRIMIDVGFYLPEHRPEKLAPLGEKYRSSYARLWDQDEDDDAPGSSVGACQDPAEGLRGSTPPRPVAGAAPAAPAARRVQW